MNVSKGAESICKLIQDKIPFFVGKIGTSELDVILFYINHRQKDSPKSYPIVERTHLTKNGGIFPATNESIDAWARHMINDVLPAGDGYAEWNPIRGANERIILNILTPNSERFPLRALEPYYMPEPDFRWTHKLAGVRIAVVSPFSKTIAAQWERKEEIWKGLGNIWNSVFPTIIPVFAGYSPYLTTGAGKWPSAVISGGWRAAVESIVSDVVASGAKFAIVGCGALSLPVCYALKMRGISAIHLGGATQILFGIKGRRWLSHGVISTFFNDAWVFPDATEVPSEALAVEGGCYW